MKKIVYTILIFIQIFILCACGNKMSDDKDKSSDKNDSTLNESSEEIIGESTSTKPDKSTYEVMRELALSGMSEEEVENLISTIKKRNEYLERCFTYENYGVKLKDPNALLWNEFTSTGEIQIGWGVDSEVWKARSSYDMSDEEFYQKYGSPVITDNEYDGNAFIAEMTNLQSTIQNDVLKKDFNHMIELMQSAMENHTVNDIIEIHKILHDMDYFLLRYGPDLYIDYVSDRSSLEKYYGSLYLYQKND